MKYQSTKKICFYTVRVPKDEAYFLYFTLEANENLCFYSTLDDSFKTPFRDILMRCPIDLERETDALLESLKRVIRVDLLSKEIITDEIS